MKKSFFGNSFSLLAIAFLVVSGFFVVTGNVFAKEKLDLGVTEITAVKTFATADGSFANGWSWVFDVTVPTDEKVLNMKFANWVSGSNTILAKENIRFYSAQSSNAFDSDHAITINDAGEYSDVMNLDPSADIDSSKGGIQIEITIEAAVPNGSAGGSYSTSYGIKSSLDTIAPVITINGTSPTSAELGSVYGDEGATAIDNVDGNLTSSIILSGTVDTSIIGNYEVNYNVSDSIGNKATKVTRIVEVKDTTEPTITLIGDNPQIIEFEGKYSELGATVTDNQKETITPKINSSAVKENKLGSYDVIYTATDESKNIGTATRTVNVVAKKVAISEITGVTAPVKGETPVTTVDGTKEYTATITWDPADSPFATKTVYTATITITPKTGYTLTGVSANLFTVAGATATNSANSGVVTAVFPMTSTLYVGAGKTYTTIQSAIDAAKLVDDDITIYVAPGTYNENLTITKAVNLVGENKDTTIIKGVSLVSPQDNVIWINDVSSVMSISGFTIDGENCGGTNRGIRMITSSNITIEDNNIINFSRGGIVVGTNSFVANNTITAGSGNGAYGIWINGAENTISNNIITSFTKEGIIIVGPSDPTNQNNVIKKNTIISDLADANTYGIYISNSGNNTIGGISSTDGNIITLQTNSFAYGVKIINDHDGHPVSNTIQNNKFDGGNRIIEVAGFVGGTTTFSDNTIGETTAPSHYGVMIYGGSAIISGNTFNNVPGPIQFGRAGGAADMDIEITNNIFNGGGDNVAAIYGSSGNSLIINQNKFNLATGIKALNKQVNGIVDATNNWWGTAEETEVAAKISEYNGKVNYLPLCMDSACSVFGTGTAPTVTNLTHDESAKTITYTFSEPVQLVKQGIVGVDAGAGEVAELSSGLLGIYTIDNLGNYGPNEVAGTDVTGAILEGNTLTVTYSGSLINETSTNYVIDAWGYSITDLAGNRIAKDGPNQVFTVIAPTFNGNESGNIKTDKLGVVSGTLIGTYTITISGQVSEYVDNLATFTGTVSGDIKGSITATVNSNGIDTMSGTITGTGAIKPVRIIGTFPQTGTDGDFTGEIITGLASVMVDSMTISGEDTVVQNNTIQMIAEILPTDAANKNVIWSIYVNDTEIATIDENTGILTGLKAGSATIIAKAIDGSLKDAIKTITVTDVIE